MYIFANSTVSTTIIKHLFSRLTYICFFKTYSIVTMIRYDSQTHYDKSNNIYWDYITVIPHLLPKHDNTEITALSIFVHLSCDCIPLLNFNLSQESFQWYCLCRTHKNSLYIWQDNKKDVSYVLLEIKFRSQNSAVENFSGKIHCKSQLFLSDFETLTSLLEL